MSGPLRGLRVLELAGLGPAPFCAMLLADMGADVVCVERLSSRRVGLELLNRGKRSIVLDLKSDRETALRLVEQADVLIEGFRPGVAERLGIGPDVCLQRNPRLVYGRMTGWGQDGPRAQTAGHDITYIAVTGALHAIGTSETPVVPLNLLGDFGGGALYLATGILAALWEARSSGVGQVVDAAIVDGAAHLMTMQWSMLAGGAWQDRRASNLLDGGAAFYRVYETSDGRHVAVGPLERQFFAEFMERLGLDPSTEDLAERLEHTFKTRTRDEWAAAFADGDACVAPVLSMREAPQNDHLAARGTFLELDGVTQPAPAPRFSRTPSSVDRRPPEPGEHTAEILAEWSTPTCPAE